MLRQALKREPALTLVKPTCNLAGIDSKSCGKLTNFSSFDS